MLIAFTDWMIDITSGLSDEQMQEMLRSEHGGLNETFADVAESTGDKKYLDCLLYTSRKRVAEMDYIEKTDKIDKLGSKRGAALYKFNGKAYRKDPKFKI